VEPVIKTVPCVVSIDMYCDISLTDGKREVSTRISGVLGLIIS
jgi:hypothetical protein